MAQFEIFKYRRDEFRWRMHTTIGKVIALSPKYQGVYR
jgi:uncharacterized protein YegP (UPF0339 family)